MAARRARLPLLLGSSALALCASLCGCTRGFIYTNVRDPLVLNMNRTPRGEQMARGGTKTLKEPLSGAGVQVEWASRGIGDIAKENGLGEIYYADLHTVSILGGIWKRVRVEVYGAPDPEHSR